MKVWVTKYVLSKGVEELEVQPQYSDRCFGSMAVRTLGDLRTSPPGKIRYFRNLGVDYHLTRESAVAYAEEKREKEIRRIERDIKRLEKLKTMKF